jgi:hypothetical protein
MGRYIDTRGLSNVAIGICGRCSLKFPLVDLHPDPNSPGLLVCGTPGQMTSKGRWSGGWGCADMLDPYRLPPHQVEDITLTMPRPDDPLITNSVVPGSHNWQNVAAGPYTPPQPGVNTGGLKITSPNTPVQDTGGQGAGQQTPNIGSSS